jgi:hypothetical protein
MKTGQNEPQRVETAAKLTWPPTKEDLERLYVEEHLSAMKISDRYGLIYPNPKSGETLILYHLKRHGISRRDAAEHIRKVTEEMVDVWVKRYNAGDSLKKVAGEEVSPVTVFNHLRKRGLQLRDKVEAQIIAVSIHEKSHFSGDPLEKAYMRGYARGDLWITTHGRAVRARTATTHPAMLELFTNLFSPYGPVYEYPRNAKLTGFEWSIDADLDESFDFLLIAEEDYYADKAIFLSFLAGFFDAEGSIVYHKKRWGGGFEVNMTNMDLPLLQKITAKLVEFGFHPILNKKTYDPTKRKIAGPGWIWRLELVRYEDINKLLRCMPLRHREKVLKTAIAIKLPYRASIPERAEVIEQWEVLLQKIEDEVRGSIRAAADTVTNFYQS